MTDQRLPDGWTRGLAITHCRAGESAMEAARRSFGPRALIGFWNSAPEGATVVGAVSVRQGDPRIAVYLGTGV